METRNRKPPDKSSFLVCHPSEKINIVLCIICEAAFYLSEVDKKAKHVGKFLIICPKHKDFKPTSKVNENTLNEDAKKIIAQVKLHEKEKLRDEMLQEIADSQQPDYVSEHESTLLGENNQTIMALKNENFLLRQLNTELQERCKILKELREANIHTPNITYASALAKTNTKKKQVPDIVVKSKNPKNNIQTYNTVIQTICDDTDVPINKVSNKKDGTTIIKCEHKEHAQKIQNILTEKIGNDFNVEKYELKNPRMKIVGIQNNMSNEDLENDINGRNFMGHDTKCSVIHTYPIKNNTQKIAIIDVGSTLYSLVRKNNNKIYVGHQCCRAYDDLNLKPCVKCGRFGHSWKKCELRCCLKCGGEHEFNECNVKTLKCTNCMYSNTKYAKNYDVNHMVTDTNKCEHLKFRISKYTSSTDYPIDPEIPRYLANLGPEIRKRGNKRDLPSVSHQEPAQTT